MERGLGSVFRRGRMWVAQVSIGSPPHRKYRRRSATMAGKPNTRRGAVEALEELRAELRAGLNPSGQSLGDYLQRWLAETARPMIAQSSFTRYRQAIAHLDEIAPVRLRDLTALDVEHALNGLADGPGRPLAPKTVNTIHAVLRMALASAQDRGLVPRNVARQVPLRRIHEKERTVLDPDLARRILSAVRGDRYEAAYALAMLGMRQGEILGLAWEDVDLTEGSLRIRRQLKGSGPKAVRSQPKTRGSAGVLPLPPFVIERLIAHRDLQRIERPVASLDGGLVFVTPRGYAVAGAWLTRHFQGLLRDAGLPRLTLHEMRHAAASLLLGVGVHPRVAQELLRHSTSRTTLDVYSHVSPGQRREAVDALQRAIGDER